MTDIDEALLDGNKELEPEIEPEDSEESGPDDSNAVTEGEKDEG